MSSEINACGKTENRIENRKIRSEEVKAAIDSDQQTKLICGEGDDKENLDDLNKMAEVKNDQHAAILEPQCDANSCSSLKKEINIKRKLHESAARTNPTSIHPIKFQRKIKFRRIYTHQKCKEVFLRRKSPKALRRNQKHFSHGNMVSESSCENHKSLESQDLLGKKPRIADENNSGKKKDSSGSQKPFSHGNMVSESSCENHKSLESQDLLGKKPRIADENNSERKKDILRSFMKKPLILNELQCPTTSSKQSQEVSTNKNRCTISARPIFTLKVHPAAIKSHSLKVRSGGDVWEHFKWYLKTNKEWLDRFTTDGISEVNVTTSQCENPNKTETDIVRTELQDNLRWEMPEIRDTISTSPLKKIEHKRLNTLNKARQYENLIKKITVFGQKTEDMEKKIDCVSEARKLRKMLHALINYLCDFDIVFQILKEKESNSTSLTESPSLEPEINTFSSLFLCQYLSLYFEIPIEKIIERIDFANYRLTCQMYRNKKEKFKLLREMRVNIAETAMCYFISSLDSCRVEMENEILGQEDLLIEDLRIAIEKNITCLNELLSTGSLVVFTMLRYLNESRRQVLYQLFFMDNKRPDIFT